MFGSTAVILTSSSFPLQGQIALGRGKAWWETNLLSLAGVGQAASGGSSFRIAQSRKWVTAESRQVKRFVGRSIMRRNKWSLWFHCNLQLLIRGAVLHFLLSETAFKIMFNVFVQKQSVGDKSKGKGGVVERLSILWFTSQIHATSRAGMGQAKARNQALHPGFLLGLQVFNYLSYHLPLSRVYLSRKLDQSGA